MAGGGPQWDVGVMEHDLDTRTRGLGARMLRTEEWQPRQVHRAGNAPWKKPHTSVRQRVVFGAEGAAASTHLSPSLVKQQGRNEDVYKSCAMCWRARQAPQGRRRGARTLTPP